VTGSLYKYGNKIVDILRLKEDREVLHKMTRRPANRTGNILHKYCLLRHITEGKKEGVKE
jgi:hypothetical protein